MATKKAGKARKGKRAEDEPGMNDLMTIAEAAELRGVSVAAIGELVRRGRLNSVERFGRKLVYRAEVESFERQRAGWPKGKSRKSGN
jgi:excisionase family DNA binding protein